MLIRNIITAAALAAVMSGGAAAQPAPAPVATFDPDQLPAIQGTVGQYSLTPRGDVDGLILADGTEVHLPPHLGAQLVFAVKPGEQVTIRGLKARVIPMIQAMSVRNDATGVTVTDTGAGGPPEPRGGRQWLSDDGTIKEVLHGPRGDLNGALLADGTIIRMPPPEALRQAALLVPGHAIAVQGEGSDGPLGRVIDVRALGPDPARLAPIARPSPPDEAAAPPPGPDAAPPPR